MSPFLIQDQSNNETPAQTSPHPYIRTEEEVTEDAEEEQAVDSNDQLQLPNYIMQSIIFPGYEDADTFPIAALDDMNGTTRGRQQLHNGTIRPDQTYIVPPPEYTPEGQPLLTTVEPAPQEQSLTSTSHQTRVLDNLEHFSRELNSLDRTSAHPATTAASQGVDGQDFQRPRLSFHHTPIPQLEWPGRRTQREHREEQGQRERGERQQLGERQQSMGQASSTVLPSQAQEPETSTDDDDDDELDPPFPPLSRQPRAQIRFINRANPTGPAIPADGRLHVIPRTVIRMERSFQIQYEEHPPTESFTPQRRRLHLIAMATPARPQRERSHIPIPITSLNPPRRRDTDHRFRHLLSHYHSHAAPPTPPSRPPQRPPLPPLAYASPLPTPPRPHSHTSAPRTRTRSPVAAAAAAGQQQQPRPLTRAILEAHARNPRVNPHHLPWNAAPFVIACQRLRIRAAAAGMHSTASSREQEQEQVRAALQREEQRRSDARRQHAVLEAERVTAAVTQLALCGALTDSAAVLAGVEGREGRYERGGRGRGGGRTSGFEGRGWVPVGRIVTPAERRGMRAALARRERLGEQVGLLAEWERCYGRAMGGWLFDVWVAQAVGSELALSSGLGAGAGDRYGRRERVGLGWVGAPVPNGEDGGDGGDRYGGEEGGDSGYVTDDSDDGSDSDSDTDSEHGHVHNRHPEEVRFPSTAGAAVGESDEDNGFRGFHFVPDGDDDEEGVGEGWVEWREGGPGALDGRFVVRDVLW